MAIGCSCSCSWSENKMSLKPSALTGGGDSNAKSKYNGTDTDNHNHNHNHNDTPTTRPSAENASLATICPDLQTTTAISPDGNAWYSKLPQTDHINFFKTTDWSKTLLGPLSTWNFALRIHIFTLFADSRPACLYWSVIVLHAPRGVQGKLTQP